MGLLIIGVAELLIPRKRPMTEDRRTGELEFILILLFLSCCL
jgi:hypothetical protein